LAEAELARKLGFKAGYSVCILGASPEGANAVRAACGVGAALTEKLGRGTYDVILFWPRRRKDLEVDFARLQGKIRPDGAVWAVIPKKASPRSKGLDFAWEDVQAAGLTTDLVDNKVASITAEEYGTRFVIRKDRRGA
jgi:hypothetical protein